ncbi:nucleopolyhedrovirus P10 family protein [Streptomyces sp. NPDC087903]|uniref:nucleopolyhedrovirus P10 family protein n=1 Tax=Streptomyces sp. NPDC087903 TaxID=3365819 RepID=UPI00381E6962
MTADQWTRAVRHQLGLGRLLPLGGPGDGAWISERAADTVLRRAADEVRGVRLTALRIALADPEDTREPAVPPPPSALPPGALRVTAEFAASASQPLPTAAARLRKVLAAAATERLGLTVTEVDLRVTDLLEGDEVPSGSPAQPEPEPTPGPPRTPDAPDAPASAARSADEQRVAAAALTVPGVVRVTGARVEELGGGQVALPHRHVRLEVAVGLGVRALDVALEVRARVAQSLPDHPTAAVLVAAVS